MIKYLNYILEHKKNVFIECWKEKMYLHAFTHDLSKFLPNEFFAYANYNFQNKNNNTEKAKIQFEKAWQHHKDNNKHHWNYWSERNLEMPIKYLKQMICDWKAMNRNFGGTAQEFYLKNYRNVKLNNISRIQLEHFLNINDSIYHNFGNTLEDLIKSQGIDWWNRSYGDLKVMYEVDLLEVLGLK